jgi:hypothetical protein
VVRHDPTTSYNAVVYEIWCAGLSANVLCPIDTQQVTTWDALLQASYGWKELYKGSSKMIADLRRSALPGAALDSGTILAGLNHQENRGDPIFPDTLDRYLPELAQRSSFRKL